MLPIDTKGNGNMTLEQIDSELESIQAKIAELAARQNALAEQRNRILSQRFIAENGITLSDVQRHDAEGVPYFTTLHQFVPWLQQHSNKTWVAWNGVLLKTSDVVAGVWNFSAPGRLQELLDAEKGKA